MDPKEKALFTLGLAVILFMVFLLVNSTAKAGERVMVAPFNENVRIVLSLKPCPMMKNAMLAVAQRIDKQYLRGCYTYEPDKKLVRIQWSADESDFTMIDADRFKPAELP